MEGCKRRMCSWWMTSSSKILLGLMVPLIVVTGLVALGSSSSSSWLFNSNYYPWVSSAPFSGNLNLSAALSPPKDGGVRLDLRWMVMGGREREEARSDDYGLNRSTAPPLAVETREHTQEDSVRF